MSTTVFGQLPRADLEALKAELLPFGRMKNGAWTEIYSNLDWSTPPPMSAKEDKGLALRHAFRDAMVSIERQGEGTADRAARLFDILLAAPTEAPRSRRTRRPLSSEDLQHMMAWRALFPIASSLTAMMLIGLVAVLTKTNRRSGTANYEPPSFGRLRSAYGGPADGTPPPKVSAVLLSVYTQSMHEQSRVNGSHVLEAHARGATMPGGLSHATNGRPPLTPHEKEHPIRFATKEAFEPTPELWIHGDDDHRPTSIGIPACTHCRAWLFDAEACPACMNGKLAAAFAHKPAGEDVGRFEITPLSTRHDGPIVTDDQKAYRVFVPFDEAEASRITAERKLLLPYDDPER